MNPEHMVEETPEVGVLNILGETVSEDKHDTTPPTGDIGDDSMHLDAPQFELTDEQRAADRVSRIADVVSRVMPGVKARKIGHNPTQPWLSNPHLEETVKATIEVLYDLNVR